jgi:hypothetical protein
MTAMVATGRPSSMPTADGRIVHVLERFGEIPSLTRLS